MRKLYKPIIKMTPPNHPLHKWATKRLQEKEILEWERKGKPVPPPHIIKQRTLKAYAQLFGLKILVETGTYYGDMVEAMKETFDCIYSIELSKELYEKATERFKNVKNIELIQGDSGVELGYLIRRLSQPALFWLDGHYSKGDTAKGDKDTPICEELDHILNSRDRGHVIIIDDARMFGTDPNYPSIEELTKFVKTMRPDTNIDIQDDSIRITPKQ